MNHQLDYIFFFYGLGFILLASVCYSIVKRGGALLPYKYLALFGLTHGLKEWLDMIAFSLADSPSFQAFRSVLLLVSFVFLVEFGRLGVKAVAKRGPGGWVTWMLSGLGSAGLFFGNEWIIRYSLGLTGAALCAAAFFMASRVYDGKTERRLLTSVGVLFSVYAVATGLIAPKAALEPASFINYEQFSNLTGIPVQLVRGILAVAAAVCMWRIYNCSKSCSKNRYICVFIGAVVGLLILGWAFTEYSGDVERQEIMEVLQRQSVLSGYAVDMPDEIIASRIAESRLKSIATVLLLIVLWIGFYVAYEMQRDALIRLEKSRAELSERERLSAFGAAVSRGLAQTESLREMLQHCTETMVEHLDVAFARIWTLNEQENVLELQASAGMYTHIDGGHARVPVGKFKIGLIAQEKKPHLTNSVATDPRVSDQDWARREGMVSFAGYPLIVDDAIVGVMAVFARKELSENTTAKMAAVANSIAVGIQRKEAEERIRLHAAAMDAADDLIAILDRRGHVIFANNAYQSQSGYSADEITERSMCESLCRGMESIWKNEVEETISQGRTWTGEVSCETKEKTFYTADISIAPIGSGGLVKHLIVIGRNVTERKEYENMLDYQAHHDGLTGLPNRKYFSDELAKTTLDRREKNSAVLFIDLDKFKLVNDTMGHRSGDELLIQVAGRLASCLRDGDMLARMGGDEFTVLLRSLRSVEEAGNVASRMLEKMSEPFDIGDHRLVIGASIGISIFPLNASDVEGILKSADAAMYKAKESGRNNYQFYSDELNQANIVRMELEQDLREALGRNELKVYYQPIVNIDTMEVAGGEALLRWEHPVKGMISPGLFIPVAEETGMIVDMGKFVLEKGCSQAVEWINGGWKDFRLSVNTSPVQLRSDTFIEDLLGVLSVTGMSPANLDIEITETALSRNDSQEMEVVRKLKAMGIRTCLDDFGIGYSSLSRLKDFPIVHMKVDGSFIRDIEHDSKDRAMTQSIISMAHNLGIQVTAEWIENEEQMETVKALGCNFAQGFLISPALLPEDFEEFVKNWAGLSSDIRAA